MGVFVTLLLCCEVLGEISHMYLDGTLYL
jgi:hypothetical protein